MASLVRLTCSKCNLVYDVGVTIRVARDGRQPALRLGDPEVRSCPRCATPNDESLAALTNLLLPAAEATVAEGLGPAAAKTLRDLIDRQTDQAEVVTVLRRISPALADRVAAMNPASKKAFINGLGLLLGLIQTLIVAIALYLQASTPAQPPPAPNTWQEKELVMELETRCPRILIEKDHAVILLPPLIDPALRIGTPEGDWTPLFGR